MNLSSVVGTLKETAEQVRVKARGTELEKKLLEALSGENWGASSSLLNQIAQATYDFDKYSIILKAMWHAMEATATSWRKVFKALSLLDHLVKNGNERIVEDARDRMGRLRGLSEYTFYEGSIDRGSGVREKAQNLIELLRDNDRIREERDKARQLREKFAGFAGSSGYSSGYGGTGGGFRSGEGSSFGGSAGGGIGSYANGGIGSESFGGRSRPGRYSDDASTSQPSSSYSSNISASSGGNGRYSDEPSVAPVSDQREKTKRFDIKIKQKEPKPAPAAVAPPTPSPAPAPGVDLLGGDIAAAPTTGADPFAASGGSGATSDFDTFPAGGNAPAVGPAGGDFGAWAAAPAAAPAPPTAFAADPFAARTGGAAFEQFPGNAAPQPPAAPMSGMPTGMGFANVVTAAQAVNAGAAGVAAQQALWSQAPAPQAQAPMPAPAPAAGMHPQPQPAQEAFGEFQSQPQPTLGPTSTTLAAPASKSSAMLGSGLVDLGSLSLNDAGKGGGGSGGGGSGSKSPPSNKFKNHDSFRGLDGFSTNPLPMSMGVGSAAPTGQRAPMPAQGMGGMPMMGPGTGMMRGGMTPAGPGYGAMALQQQQMQQQMPGMQANMGAGMQGMSMAPSQGMGAGMMGARPTAMVPQQGMPGGMIPQMMGGNMMGAGGVNGAGGMMMGMMPPQQQGQGHQWPGGF